MRTLNIKIAVILIGLSEAASFANGLDDLPFHRLAPADANSHQAFGVNVDIEDNLIVIGASKDNDKGDEAGAVYVYKRDDDFSIKEMVKLTASDGQAGDRFGASVNIAGDTILVGATYADADKYGKRNTGAVYIFKRREGRFVQVDKIVSPTSIQDGLFGFAIESDGTTAIVGAYQENAGALGPQAGAAYVLRYNGAQWFIRFRLTSSDTRPYSKFGSDVDISGDTIVVGAYYDNEGKQKKAGAAYIFERINGHWSQTQKIIPEDRTEEDRFGNDVEIEGDLLAIGAYRHESVDDESGAAYLYRREQDGSFGRPQKLFPQDGHAQDFFGLSLALKNGVVAVTAPRFDSYANDVGLVYIYTEIDGEYTLVKRQSVPGLNTESLFGFALDFGYSELLVGTPKANGAQESSGAVYIISMD